MPIIEPLIWMFKVKDFKKHFLYLALSCICCWILAILFVSYGVPFLTELGYFWGLAAKAIFVALYSAPFLLLSGYFWYMTDNIINREVEPVTASTFTGKVICKNVIALPEIDVKRFLWRGIASIVASILMYLPFVLLMIVISLNLGIITAFWHLTEEQITLAAIAGVLFSCLMIPALLWNYARRDSIVAVLNIPKALDIMLTYPWRYLLNTVLYIIFSIVQSLIVRGVIIMLGLESLRGCSGACPAIPEGDGALFLIKTILFILIVFINFLYWLFVYSYLLGTITPHTEN